MRTPTLVVFLLGVLALSTLVLTVSAQSVPRGVYPGDPVSEADKVFVSLETGDDATCGVTAANNIRCWGNNRFAPMWAGGFTDVSTGISHSCGIRLDGTVQCWGTNTLGSNMLVPPTDNGAAIKFKAIDSGPRHTCGIRADNDGMVCWGNDAAGQASGTRAPLDGRYVQYDYSNDAFVKIRASRVHTCGLIALNEGDTGTNLRCWGENRNERGWSTVPAAYSSTLFNDIDSGYDLNCGIIDGGDDDGKAVCWGTNLYGVIGTAIGTDLSERYIGEPSSDRFTKISTGQYHVCGIKTDGTISCWGATNDSGLSQAYGQADVPVEYQSSTFSDVVSAQYHTCAILDGRNGQVEGDIICWGAEIPYNPLTPYLVQDGRIFDPDHPYPPPHRFPQIQSGIYFNCGLSFDRDLVCWGGSTLSPGIVDGPFKTIDMGEQHVCGIRDSGLINCWGFNNNLQASGWTGSPSAVSVTVEDLTTDYSFKSVSASYFHTCGILDGRRAGQGDGSVICWGHGSNGQATPPAGMTFASLSAGWYHTCGLLDGQNGQLAGKVVCWGAENDLDADGNIVRTIFNADSGANFGQTNVPPELEDVPLSTISTSRYQTCGIRADNDRLVCWGFSEFRELPEELAQERFSAVATSWYATCGIDSESLVRCWGPGRWATQLQQFRVPTDYAETRFVAINMGTRHACATKEDGTVICWGADADVNTPQLEIYSGSTIVNTRQAWVPREFRASPINPPPTPTPAPIVWPKVLRIEPSIRGVSLRPGEPVHIDVEVYGRQDIRDDSLGDSPEVTFDWSAWVLHQQSGLGSGEFAESLRLGKDRERNGAADDQRVLYTAPSEPGRYRVSAALEPGAECLGAREFETAQDAVDRCAAVFDVTVLRDPVQASPSPEPIDPEGDIPGIIVDEDGRNYEVFTPGNGGEFVTEKCSLKIPAGAVNNMEVIGVSAVELESPEEQRKVEDLRFMTDGVQCRIDAVDAQGARLIDYRLGQPGEVCMPLPKTFTRKAVDTLVTTINEDATLTRLTSRLYLASPEGLLKVCGNISTLSATTVVALPGEVAGELPDVVDELPDIGDIETGGGRLSEPHVVALMLFGILVISVATMAVVMIGRRGSNL